MFLLPPSRFLSPTKAMILGAVVWRSRRKRVDFHLVGDAWRKRSHFRIFPFPRFLSLFRTFLSPAAAFSSSSSSAPSFGSSLAILSAKSRPALADVVSDADTSPVAVIAAIGAVFASASDEPFLTEAVSVRRTDAVVGALLDEARFILQAAVFGELESDRRSLERLSSLISDFEDELEVSNAGFESGTRQRDAEIGGSARNEARVRDGEFEPFHDGRVFGANMQELVRVFALWSASPAPARPRHVDRIGERRNRRQSGSEFGAAAHVVRQFVTLDDIDLHGNAGESTNLVLADPHRHLRVGETE